MCFFHKIRPIRRAWPLTVAALAATIIVGCAPASWGDGGQAAQRYYYFIKSQYLAHNNQMEAALENMALASMLDKDSYYLKLETARMYALNSDSDGALRYARAAMELKPQAVEPKLFAAGVSAAAGRLNEAAQYYQQALVLEPKNTEALTRLGILHAQTGRNQEAEAAFKKLVAADSGYLSYYYLGRFYTTVGRAKEAISALSTSVRKKDDFVPALTELAVLYEQENNNKAAERTYRALIKARPDSTSPRAQLARLLVKTGRKKEAEAVIKEMIGPVAPGTDEESQLKMQLGRLYLSQGLAGEAVKEFAAVAAADPGNDLARYLLASALLDNKKVAEAREHLRKIAPSSDLYVDASLLLASTLEGTSSEKRLEEALEIILRANAARPGQPRLMVAQALILEEMDRLDEARALLRKATDDFPEEAEIQFRLGVVEDKLGRQTEAIEAMRQAIELDPNHADALNYLAYTWAERRENLTEALILAERADSLKPDSGYILDTVGWIHHRLGDHRQALVLLERAAPLSNHDPVIMDHLGDVLLALGREKEALEAYRKALQQGFANPEELNEKIKRLSK